MKFIIHKSAFVLFAIVMLSNSHGNIDTHYTDSLKSVSIRIAYQNLDSAIGIADELLVYSRNHNYDVGISNAFCTKCMVNAISGKIDTALYYCQLATDHAIMSESTLQIARSHAYLANVQRKTGQTEEAFINYSRALECYLELSNYKGLIGTYHNLGVLYDQLGRKAMAIDQFNKAISLRDHTDDIGLIANSYSSLASVYASMNQFSKAIEFFNKAIDNYTSNGEQSRTGHPLQSIGRALKDSGLYVPAYNKYLEAQKIYRKYGFENKAASGSIDISGWFIQVYQLEINLKQEICKVLNIPESSLLDSALKHSNIYSEYFNDSKDKSKHISAAILKGVLEFHAANYNQAIKHYNKAKKLSEEFEYPHKKTISLEGLIECYTELGNTKKLVSLVNELFEFNESLHKQQLAEIGNRIEISYKIENELLQNQLESERKSEEISQLKQKDQINSRNTIILLISMILLVLLIIVGILIYRQKQLYNKRHNEILEIKHTQLEQKVLRTQMNPHFISNSLTAIQAFILKNKSIESASYLAKFAKLMRLIIESSRMNLISLDEELKILQFYLDLQKLRFDNQLEFNISIEEKLDIEEIQLPPMLLQPFIENAVEHGISKNKGIINITFNESKSYLLVAIEDNGIGIAASKADEQNNDRKSYSTKITQERIENLNLRNNVPITFNILDNHNSENKTGTRIEFNIPLDLKMIAL
jgi:tetratricopeptide (TPR) repeat protein